jgi:hypothetical protein
VILDVRLLEHRVVHDFVDHDLVDGQWVDRKDDAVRVVAVAAVPFTVSPVGATRGTRDHQRSGAADQSCDQGHEGQDSWEQTRTCADITHVRFARV